MNQVSIISDWHNLSKKDASKDWCQYNICISVIFKYKANFISVYSSGNSVLHRLKPITQTCLCASLFNRLVSVCMSVWVFTVCACTSGYVLPDPNTTTMLTPDQDTWDDCAYRQRHKSVQVYGIKGNCKPTAPQWDKYFSTGWTVTQWFNGTEERQYVKLLWLQKNKHADWPAPTVRDMCSTTGRHAVYHQSETITSPQMSLFCVTQ